MLNKVLLIGHLGKDPEMRKSSGGKPIATLSVATSESWRDKATGDRKQRTEWHRVVIFNEKLAEIAEKYLRKGSKVWLEGQLQTRKWNDTTDGIDRWTTEIVLSQFRAGLVLLDRAEGRSEENYGAAEGPQPPAAGDDEIGF